MAEDERLNVQSGPFKGKPQQWFTRAEVVALLAATSPASPAQPMTPEHAQQAFGHVGKSVPNSQG
jgi:hypothetical protein